MCALRMMHLSPQSASKRKHFGDGDTPIPKRPRVTADPAPSTSHYLLPYEHLLARLRPKYELKTMSVMPSTSINKIVDKALQHLGRFSSWDQTVLPGVVFFSAKFTASTKLITISELVRRRIGESEQKWYQYNVLGEMESEDVDQEEFSTVEDTFMGVATTSLAYDSDADDYFEGMKPTIHDRAVQPAKVRHKSYMSVLFSRVPLDELKGLPDILVQTNEESIEFLRKKRRTFGR